jgi:large subunit ribosomal protein L10
VPKPEKVEAVNDVKERLSRAKSLVVTDYRGLTVAEMTDLRNKLRAQGVEYKIVKNRLAKIALRESNMNTLDEYLKGTTALAFGLKDPVSPAKVLSEFAKGNDKLKIIGGIMDNNVLDAKGIDVLAKLPSREILLSRMLGSLIGPVQKVAYGLNQTVARIAYAVDAVARQKAGQ